jgi:hypothetical protein
LFSGRSPSAVTQCNGKRDHDHAGKCKVEIHEECFRDSRIGGILPGAGKNKKLAFMIGMIDRIDDRG